MSMGSSFLSEESHLDSAKTWRRSGSFIDFPPALFSLSSLVLSQEMAQVAPCFQALILTHIFWEVAWQVTRRSRVSVDFSNESWLARLLYKVVL